MVYVAKPEEDKSFAQNIDQSQHGRESLTTDFAEHYIFSKYRTFWPAELSRVRYSCFVIEEQRLASISEAIWKSWVFEALAGESFWMIVFRRLDSSWET